MKNILLSQQINLLRIAYWFPDLCRNTDETIVNIAFGLAGYERIRKAPIVSWSANI